MQPLTPTFIMHNTLHTMSLHCSLRELTKQWVLALIYLYEFHPTSRTHHIQYIQDAEHQEVSIILLSMTAKYHVCKPTWSSWLKRWILQSLTEFADTIWWPSTVCAPSCSMYHPLSLLKLTINSLADDSILNTNCTLKTKRSNKSLIFSYTHTAFHIASTQSNFKAGSLVS